MHQTRQQLTTKIPLPRKGTKYIARASSHLKDSVPVLIAVRDMLKLARTAKEVNEMLKLNLLKINGKLVRDYHTSIKLFDILEAGKKYKLSLTENHRFILNETKEDKILAEVINKKLVQNGKIQLNLHNGYNVITKDKINVGDSVYISFDGKITKHIPFEQGSSVFVMTGKHAGKTGKVELIHGNRAKVKFSKEQEAEIDSIHLIAQ